MTQKTNSFERFWKELKRRKVVHVITVYAAIAFVILQLVDIVAEPLRLPVSTKALVIVLLCIGFVIAIFLSWVYDITPSGVKKTKPVSSVKNGDKVTSPASRGWKIATYVGGILIIALVAFNFISRRSLDKDFSKLEKSIAVLPFRNDSSSDSTTYFIDGLMDEILNNLQKIGAFSRVLSRTSTEQFRGSAIPAIPEIAKKLNVSYVVEGSGQKYGNKFILRVQLITGKNERHLWARSYDREIKQTTDIINVQSDIAQSIAAELKAAITPEEKQLIEKTPTANLTALDFYQRGREEHTKYWIDNGDKAALQKAENLYHRALNYDSTFAQAYTGLAWVYWDKHSSAKEYFSENYMDSVLILANIALSFDSLLSEAYTLKGTYFREKGKSEQAIKEYDKAIKLNPNDWMAYAGNGYWYNNCTDLVNLINSWQKAASLNHGPELSTILSGIGYAYFCAGFLDKSKYYYQEGLKLDGDSSKYYYSLASNESNLANFNKSIDFGVKSYEEDSTNNNEILELLGNNYERIGQHEESLKYYKKYFERLKTRKEFTKNLMYRIGYAYWQNGYKKEAEYFFNEQIIYCNRMNELKRIWGQSLFTYYDLAAVYAFRKEKGEAYKNLRIFNQIQRTPLWMVTLIKNDPLFDSIRNEPEFQQILRDVEAKYQAEHERVRKWLEETGQL